MGFFEKLYKTYDRIHEQYADELIPIYHTVRKAHIEVILDQNSTCVNHCLVGENRKDYETIIPCTEKSQNRVGNVEPHSLCDTLQYLCRGVVQNHGFNDRYVDQLSKWNNSTHTHPFVCIILQYIMGGTLRDDVSSDVAKLDVVEERCVMVRFRIQGTGDMEDRCYRNADLFRSWIDYIREQKDDGKRTICVVSGEELPVDGITGIHQSHVRHPGDCAKIITSDDKNGYTFRGRLTTTEQAATVGKEVSIKAHNALTWLIKRQGFRSENQFFVAWEPECKEFPSVYPLHPEVVVEDGDFDMGDSGTVMTDVGQTFALKLNKYIAGYTTKLEGSEGIYVIGLDSLSPNKGRISVIYWREVGASDFLERVRNWHSRSAWPVVDKIEDENRKTVYKYRVYSPSPKEIVKAAYGELADDGMKKPIWKICKDIIPCIVDGGQIPPHLVSSVIRRASNPTLGQDKKNLHYKGYERDRVLWVACSL